MRNKIIATILIMVMLSSIFASSGFAAVGRQSTPLPGAVATSPAEYVFEYEGKKFVLLDEMQKDGKKYFFVLCDDVYGTHLYDASPDRDRNTCLAYWEPEDEYNMAYWLNNDFLQSGNGTGNSLPQGIKTYLDYNHEWTTEDMRGLSGYDTANKTTHPLALLSVTEWMKYITKIGQNVAGTWFMRTARTADTNGDVRLILYTGSSMTLGTNIADRANLSKAIRPCFYLSEDFFKNCKLTSAGKSVQDAIAGIYNKDLYTAEELISCFTAPAGSNVRIDGNLVVGEKLMADYDYTGIYPRDGGEYFWYVSDNESGPYTRIAGVSGNEFVLTEAQSGKYMKISVIPKSTSPFVPNGAEVAGNIVYGPIFGAAATNEALLETKRHGEDNILSKIEEYNFVFSVNTNYAEIGVSNENKMVFAKILYGMDYGNLSELRTCYRQAAALVRLNSENDSANISNRLMDEELKIDVTRYGELSDTSYVDDKLFGKGFISFETFETTYFKALAVSDVNENDRTNIKNILLYYNEYFDKDLSSVSDYLLGIIGTEILKQNYADFDALNTAVNNAVVVSENVQEPIEQERPDIKDNKEAMGFNNNGIPSIAYRNENALKIEQEDNTDVPFTDALDAGWAADSIMYLYDRGIISGYDDGTVKPTKTLTREEFVKMVVDAFVPDGDVSASSFDDVNDNAWYASYVKRGVSKGLISGVGDGKFGVGMTVTRQDMAVILYRLLSNTNSISEKTFTDDFAIADYAKEAVSKMAGIRLINGFENGTFNPNVEATRAMAAKVICDMLVYLNK